MRWPHRLAVVAAAYLAVAMNFIAGSSFESMIVPLSEDLGLSVSESSTLHSLPELAGFLIVFAAGSLALRFGRRMVIVVAACVFSFGAIVMSLAPSAMGVAIARSLIGLGTVALAVAGLSLINVTFAGTARRARAFAAVAAIPPVISLTLPNATAAVCTALGWRFVPVIWLVAGGVLLVLTVISVPGRQSESTASELATPLLAGLVLSSICLATVWLATPNSIMGIALAVAALALVILVVLMRRLRRPGLDLRVLASRRGALAGCAVALIWCVSLTFYVTIFIQFRYELPVTTAIAMLTLCQAAGIAGTFLFGFIASRIGAQRSALIAVCCAAALGLPLLVTSASSSVWLVIGCTVLLAIPNFGAIGPVTEHFLNGAPQDGSDAAAAMADGLSNVGFVAGGAVVSLLIFGTFSTALSSGLQERGYAADRADAIAAEITGGTPSVELVERDGDTDPLLRPALIDDMTTLDGAQVSALHAMGLAVTVSFGGAALTLVPGIRRRRDMSTASA